MYYIILYVWCGKSHFKNVVIARIFEKTLLVWLKKWISLTTENKDKSRKKWENLIFHWQRALFFSHVHLSWNYFHSFSNCYCWNFVFLNNNKIEIITIMPVGRCRVTIIWYTYWVAYDSCRVFGGHSVGKEASLAQFQNLLDFFEMTRCENCLAMWKEELMHASLHKC